MATMLKFDEAKLERDDNTTTVVESKVDHADIEYTTGQVTIYMEPINGVTFYITLTSEDYMKIRRPTVDVPAELRGTMVERSGQEIEPDRAKLAELIDGDVRHYRDLSHCGETNGTDHLDCGTCNFAVAVGLESTDAAYNAGAAVVKGDLKEAMEKQILVDEYKRGFDDGYKQHSDKADESIGGE